MNQFKSMTKILSLIAALFAITTLTFAQETPPPEGGAANVGATIGTDGTGSIIVEAKGVRPKPPVFYTATADTEVKIGGKRIHHIIKANVKVLQGEAETITFGLNGGDEVYEVKGEGIVAWAVRREGDKRFLDVKIPKEKKEQGIEIRMRSSEYELPQTRDITHLAPGKAVGFRSVVRLIYLAAAEGDVTQANGFTALDAEDQFETTTGGKLTVQFRRSGSQPASVELANARLTGAVDEDGKHAKFQFTARATVTEDGAKIPVLRGNAAASAVGQSANYRLQLSKESPNAAIYELVFPKAGTFPVNLEFVAIMTAKDEWRGLDFDMPAASAVASLSLQGIDEGATFQNTTIVPVRQGQNWNGFIPADGKCRIAWKPKRETAEGKLFFTTTAQIETRVGAGLLRQTHNIAFQVLQGELESITLGVDGPGEVTAVEGAAILGWSVEGEGDDRQLQVKLSQPMTGQGKLNIRSQTPVEALPTQVESLRLTPEGAIRHSGYVRLTNLGSVSLDPTGLQGLTQLNPEQYPGEAIQATQIFAYRFPASDYGYEVNVDRIQPEVGIDQSLAYETSESGHKIQAAINLDIRKAPIREFTFEVPDGYDVLGVSGAAVGDWIQSEDAVDGRKALKVIFTQEVSNRQLVNVQLENSTPAAPGNWVLPPLRYPDAEGVRGEISVSAAAGLRIGVSATEFLSEKAQKSPNPSAGVQRVFRIRERAWTATMTITQLEQSVVADVFHLYSLKDRISYASVVMNYFITGAPVSDLQVSVPANAENLQIKGAGIREESLSEENVLTVTLNKPVMGSYLLLLTYELEANDGAELALGDTTPLNVQGEQGYVHVVSPVIVTAEGTASPELLPIEESELPAEYRLLSSAPSLGVTYQYTSRPFELSLGIGWFAPAETVPQVVEFSAADSIVSSDGESVTTVTYYVNSRGKAMLQVKIPDDMQLWEARVLGRKTNAREDDNNMTLIPLPATPSNKIVQVELRLAQEGGGPLRLPRVHGDILKTHWVLHSAETDRVLVAPGGKSTVAPPSSNLRLTGFAWLSGSGLVGGVILAALVFAGMWASNRQRWWLSAIGIVLLLVASVLCFTGAKEAWRESGVNVASLQLSVPLMNYDMAAGDAAQDEAVLYVDSVDSKRANLSISGIIIGVLGVLALVYSLLRDEMKQRIRAAGIAMIAGGILAQHGGATPFLIVLGIVLALCFALPRGIRWIRGCVGCCKDFYTKRREQKAAKLAAAEAAAAASASASALVVAAGVLALMLGGASDAFAQAKVAPEGFATADTLEQTWTIANEAGRLSAKGSVAVSGDPGDQFILLRAPAVLTKFDGGDLRLTKQEIPNLGMTYVLTIPGSPEPEISQDPFAEVTPPAATGAKSFEADFEFQLEVADPQKGFAIPTGTAAVHELAISYDEAGWEFVTSAAVRVEPTSNANNSSANLLLSPQLGATVALRAKMRNVADEDTEFYVEGAHLYLPGPGVVDGRHRINIRPSQGQVSELEVQVPSGLTISSVEGPVGSWQFDADSGKLSMVIGPPQSAAFAVNISTQRGLDPLPADVELAPLTVAAAAGENGTVALAFGGEAQPESAESDTLSAVNLNDFDASLVPQGAVLHEAFNYRAGGGTIALRVAPVPPEIRVSTQEALYVGNESLTLNVQFLAEITRAGVFQLSFPIPDGLEVETVSGPGEVLGSWNESTDTDGQRRVVIHLRNKTMGQHQFVVAFAGAPPTDEGNWDVPRFQLTEASRQTGRLEVRTDPGIELKEGDKENVAPANAAGGNPAPDLAFSLLLKDWVLSLDITRRAANVTGSVLHEVTVREGQTRSVISGRFNVEHASIRSMIIELPISGEEEVKTVRATGPRVSDIIRIADDEERPNITRWELQYDGRVIGNRVDVRIEFERRGNREDNAETLVLAQFPDARQVAYHWAIRTTGRLELEPPVLAGNKGWQRADWARVPTVLRQAGNRNAPALVLRAVAPENPLKIGLKTLGLAPAQKLRVSSGVLTTVLSPLGEQLTKVDLNMEVLQRSSLKVYLEKGVSKMFSVLVNGSSVNLVSNDADDSYEFYVLPGPDDRTARVSFSYSVSGDRIDKVGLRGPKLDVPLENIRWQVIAPKGYRLTGEKGNLELTGDPRQLQDFTWDSYKAAANQIREEQTNLAEQEYAVANQLMEQGFQDKALEAFNNVANKYSNNAALNEDALVKQVELQKRQAVVGLTTRSQRQYLANGGVEQAQVVQGANLNPVLQSGDVNFKTDDYNQLIQGQDTESLDQIASHLVSNLKATDPAPQAILFPLPAENEVYTFSRTVQVQKAAALELDLRFGSAEAVSVWRMILVALVLAVFVGAIVFRGSRKAES